MKNLLRFIYSVLKPTMYFASIGAILALAIVTGLLPASGPSKAEAAPQGIVVPHSESLPPSAQDPCSLDTVECIEEQPDGKGASERLREVSAYNVGVESQTDSTPCIGATGADLCELLARGQKIVATNELPLGSRVEINGETYQVLDRMNERYHHRYDIAFPADQYAEAIEWGVRTLDVQPL